MFPALVLGLLLAPTAAPAATQPKAGTYEVTSLTPAGGTVFCLVKITPKGDGVEAEFVTSHPGIRGMSLKGATLDGDVLHVAFKGGPGGDTTFEGRVPAAGAEKILGSFESGGRMTAGQMTVTDKTELTQATAVVRGTPPEPMQKANTLNTRVLQLRQRAAQAKAADEKAKLTQEAADANKEAQAETPKLYREVLDKHADSLAAMAAAQNLIRQAGKDKIDATQVRGWAAAMLKVAQTYGKRYENDVTVQVAELLIPQAAYTDLALEYAQRAEKTLTAKDSPDQQARVLGLLVSAMKKAGKAADAGAAEARLAKVEAEMDREYLATMPPFKPTAFEGRKGQGDRVAVMELFTGAQCPPCVAADLAFDGLQKTYKHNDVVLIQYHMHIPGADPMTNPATEARWDYYRDKFPGQIGGVPSTLFNGKPQAGGGGGAPQSEAKYKQYREVIEELLEKPAGATVNLAATRAGDTITFKADVSKLSAPAESTRLRLLLVEESIRFVGSNKIRFHHMVVRAMPGSPAGIALPKADNQHTASVNLAELRQDLTKYLEDYNANGPRAPFPQPQRPLDFKGLKAIALVQDDKTGEILQAVVVDVGGDRADH